MNLHNKAEALFPKCQGDYIVNNMNGKFLQTKPEDWYKLMTLSGRAIQLRDPGGDGINQPKFGM